MAKYIRQGKFANGATGKALLPDGCYIPPIEFRGKKIMQEVQVFENLDQLNCSAFLLATLAALSGIFSLAGLNCIGIVLNFTVDIQLILKMIKFVH